MNPTPDVNLINDTTYCSGDTTGQFDFTSSVIGTTYSWLATNPINATAIGMTSTSGTGSIPSFTTTNNTNTQISVEILVTPTANGCPGLADTLNITVNPTPIINPNTNQTLCHIDSTNAVIFTSNIGGVTYQWTNSNPSISGGVIGGSGTISQIPAFEAINTSNGTETSTIIVTPLLGGCPGAPDTFSITVNPIPTVFTTYDTVFCAGNQSFNYIFDGFFKQLINHRF